METIIYNQKGEETGKITVPKEIFGLSWNADLVHQVTTSMRGNARDNIAHTKTRGEVSGTGKKPWQQKGTGRARHGSRRSPIWVGGGVAHGPRNDRNYTRKINKQAKTKALYTILSQKMRDGEILFVDSLAFGAPKARDAKIVLGSFAKLKGFERLATKPKNAALITVDKKYPELTKSFSNFGNVDVEEFRTINPLSVLNHKYLVISNAKEAIKTLESKTK